MMNGLINQTLVLSLAILFPLLGLATPLCSEAYEAIKMQESFINDLFDLDTVYSQLNRTPQEEWATKLEGFKKQIKEDPENIKLLQTAFLFSTRVQNRRNLEHWRYEVELAKKIVLLRTKEGNLRPHSDLYSLANFLLKKRAGAEEALVIAENLIRQDPQNSDYRVLEIEALMKLDLLEEAIAKTNERIAAFPHEAIWYDLQISTWNRIEFPSHYSKLRFTERDQTDLIRLLEKAIVEVPNPSYPILNQYIRTQAEGYRPGQLKGYGTDNLVILAEKMRTLAETPEQARVVEFRLSQIHLAAGDFQLAKDYFYTSLRDGIIKPWKANYLSRLERLLAYEIREPKKEDHTQWREERNDDRPDWLREREQEGFDYDPETNIWGD